MWFTVYTNLTRSHTVDIMYSLHRRVCVCVYVDCVGESAVDESCIPCRAGFVMIIPTRLPPQVGGILLLIYKHVLFTARDVVYTHLLLHCSVDMTPFCT